MVGKVGFEPTRVAPAAFEAAASAVPPLPRGWSGAFLLKKRPRLFDRCRIHDVQVHADVTFHEANGGDGSASGVTERCARHVPWMPTEAKQRVLPAMKDAEAVPARFDERRVAVITAKS